MTDEKDKRPGIELTVIENGPPPPGTKPPAPIRGKFVVKVQLSLSTSAQTRQLLIYNEDKTVFHQEPATPEIVRHLKNKAKSFWLARIRNTLIELLEPTHDRSW
jgi:hypothetical protein